MVTSPITNTEPAGHSTAWRPGRPVAVARPVMAGDSAVHQVVRSSRSAERRDSPAPRWERTPARTACAPGHRLPQRAGGVGR